MTTLKLFPKKAKYHFNVMQLIPHDAEHWIFVPK